jgi:hypothetical protein
MVLSNRFPFIIAAFLPILAGNAFSGAAQSGLGINGGVTSEFTRSALSGSAASDTNLATETSRGSALDLDMRYRPMDSAQVRTLLRFYQDWQSFSSGNGRVASVRWLSADGNIGNTLGFHAGDFRRKLTPLILWAPEAGLLQEPEIFADRRKALMEERFLGDDERLLQGFDLDYARDFDLPLSRLDVDVLGARVRRAEFLDQDGAQGFGLARSDMDRFYYGARAEATIKGHLRVGASYHRLADDASTYALFVLSAKTRQAAYGNTLNTGLSLNGQDSVLSRSLSIQGFEGGLDLAGFMQKPHLILDLSMDYARSTESNRLAWSFRTDTVQGIAKNVPITVPKKGTTAGALNIESAAGWKDSSSGNLFRVTGRYLFHDKAFLNPMAQTPTFVPSRILNTENDQGSGALYTTFDALYQGVYRFTPSRKAEGNQQAAYTKNSYNGGVWSPEDLRAFRGDPVVQLELPLGLATPNRSGFMGGVEAEWRRAVHVDLAAASMKEIQGGFPDGNVNDTPGAVPLQPTRFSMAAVGLRIDWDRLFAWRHAFQTNGSYTVRGSTRDSAATDAVAPDVSVRLEMAGLRFQCFEKWALLAGVQAASLSLPAPRLHPTSGGAAGAETVRHEENEQQWRLGVEYALTARARMTASGGMINMDVREPVSAKAPGSGGSARFSQTLLQLILELGF